MEVCCTPRLFRNTISLYSFVVGRYTDLSWNIIYRGMTISASSITQEIKMCQWTGIQRSFRSIKARQTAKSLLFYRLFIEDTVDRIAHAVTVQNSPWSSPFNNQQASSVTKPLFCIYSVCLPHSTIWHKDNAVDVSRKSVPIEFKDNTAQWCTHSKCAGGSFGQLNRASANPRQAYFHINRPGVIVLQDWWAPLICRWQHIRIFSRTTSVIRFSVNAQNGAKRSSRSTLGYLPPANGLAGK